MRVTYEDAAGRRVEAEALDVSAGGLFVPAEKIVPVGKRLAVDITLAGGSSKWSALARVIWVRERSSDAGPAGMGMKLIDTDDNLVAAIDKLVGSREPTEPGTGGSRTPSRERTVLGVGISAQSAVAATPIVTTAPAREKTQLGVGGLAAVAPVKLAAEPSEPVAREVSIPLELVPAKQIETESVDAEAEVPTRRVEITPIEPKPEAEAAPLSDASLAEAGIPRRRGRAWIAILLLLAIGGAGYAFRSRIPYATLLRALRQPQPAAPTPAPPPPTISVVPSVTSAAPPPSVVPSVTSATPPPSVAPSGSVTTRPSATASAAVSSAPTASASPGAATSARPRPPPASGSAAPSAASAAPRHSGPLSVDNPY
jgi:uncharacterized protein (TIGR02266 family)